MDMIALLLLLLGAVAILFAVYRTLESRHALRVAAAILMSLGVLSLVHWFCLGLAYAPPEPPVAIEMVDGQPVLSEHATEEMWDRLTRGRIVLDSPPQEAPSEIPEKDKAVSPTAELPNRERPAWVDHPPKRIGEVYRRVISSDRFSTVDECHRQLEQKCLEVAIERLRLLLPQEKTYKSWLPKQLSIEYVMREICRDSYVESVDSTVGEMQRVHVLMEFSPSIDQYFRNAWQSQKKEWDSHRQLALARETAVVFVAILLFLAVLYGLLRFDTMTRGYYTRRLLLAVPGAIIVLTAIALVWNN